MAFVTILTREVGVFHILTLYIWFIYKKNKFLRQKQHSNLSSCFLLVST